MTPTDQGALPSGGLQPIISWFARNHVAANLLMLAVVATGLLVSQNIRQEIYPTFTLDVVEITMEYRGASPEDVEQSNQVGSSTAPPQPSWQRDRCWQRDRSTG